MRLAFLSLFLLTLLPLWGDEELANYCVSDHYCNDCIPKSRSDNLPQTHIVFSSDEYLSGYIQALIDTHYYEYKVRVIVRDHQAYVFNLPRNDLLANSIMCFVNDIPCIDSVEIVMCCPEEFLCNANGCFDSPGCTPGDYCTMEAICEVPPPCCQISGIWFPQSNRLFLPLVADPRQVTNSGAIRFNDRMIGKHLKHVGAVVFGDEFPIFRWKDVFCWHGDLQLGVEAGIFSVFDLDHPDGCMVNTDYFVGPTVTYAVDKWSYRLRVWHMSSHLGDEFLIENPHVHRKNRSEEGVDFFSSYQLNTHIRLYGGLGYIFDSDNTFCVKPFYFQYGTEIRVFGCRNCFNKLYVQPFFAMNLLNWQEHNYSLDATYLLGLEYSNIQGVGRKFRIFGEYHNGYSVEGQFCRVRSSYAAIRIAYGF